MQVQPDIIAVTETWLEPPRIKTVKLPGYNFFHTDALIASCNGTGLAGEVGMYIKASINATVRDQFRLELPGSEDLWIEQPLKNGKQCYISVIYKHPKTNIELFHYISTNAKYPRSENLYKMLIDHLYRMKQAI